MKDGIIKADGTSRAVRGNFPATYEEFRAQAAAGTLSLDVLFQAAGWSQQPTFLNKANLLKDATAARFGLGAEAVPDQVFSILGSYNLHWWRYRPNGSHWEAVIPTAEFHDIAFSQSSSAGNATIEYSEKIMFDEAGAPHLVNPILLECPRTTDTTYLNVLVGKYFQVTKNRYTAGSSPNPAIGLNNVGYVPAGTNDFDIELDTDDDYSWIIRFSCADVGSEYVSSVGEWETLYSPSKDDFPDSGIVDGYEYEYLGVPFENAVTASEVEMGSYAGSGTSGASNPNSLTFGIVPKLVVISPRESSSTAILLQGSAMGISIGSYGNGLTTTWEDHTVTWYSTDGVNYQLNASGELYDYIAIG